MATGREMPPWFVRHLSTRFKNSLWHRMPTSLPIPVVGGRPGPRRFLLDRFGLCAMVS
jgi:hypothetical protein